MLAADGQHLQGWITSQSAARRGPPHAHRPGRHRAGTTRRRPALPGLRSAARDAPTPLRGYQILEITIPAGLPAAGRALGDITWPHEWIPVTVMDSRALRDASPGITLTPGARVNLLAREQAAKSA